MIRLIDHYHKLVSALLVIGLFIVLSNFMLSTHADSTASYASVLANSGTLSGGAALITDSGATSGQAVQFNGVAPPPASSSENIITTLYAYPTESSWTQVEDAAPTVKYAIANICAPDGSGSGCNDTPADAINPDWTPTIAALKNAGITPLIYIWTDYGGIATATVEAEMQSAESWYGIIDPMFDGTATTAGEASYYQALYNYAVGTMGSTAVVFNAGAQAPESYMFGGTSGSKEIIQEFEGTAAQFEGTSFPSWMDNYPASEFSATLSAGTSSTIGGDVTDAYNDHIGNFYEDDEAEPPNYSTLPAFWNTEVTDVKDAN
jgi:hypothetical protein